MMKMMTSHSTTTVKGFGTKIRLIQSSTSHLITPVVEADIPNRSNVYFKLENLQKSGSFKDRGIFHMVTTLMKQKNLTKLISSSGGNAGNAVATIGSILKIPVDVFVPTTTKPMMIEKIRSRDANVFIEGENWNAADAFARNAVEAESGSLYIPPYDNPLIWEGNSSIIDELKSINLVPDCIVLSVGGGGLLRGIQRGLERNGWNNTRIIAVETEGAASFAAALAAGTPVRLSKIDTVATSLGALSVTPAVLNSSIKTESLIVSDKDAIAACLRFCNDKRMLVEPACGATLSAVYSDAHWKKVIHNENDKVVVIVCGGSVVSREILSQLESLL